MSNRVGVHIRVTGTVQGVGYRAFVEREAVARGLSGWVRNRRDGSVEAVVDGAASAVQAMIAWAHRGPPSARVTDVHVGEHPGSFMSFERLPTE
jgi:acylphosphatase